MLINTVLFLEMVSQSDKTLVLLKGNMLGDTRNKFIFVAVTESE